MTEFNVIKKHPKLIEMLEKQANQDECRQLFSQLNVEDLQELKKYIAARLKKIETALWQSQQKLRNITAQSTFLDQDKSRITTALSDANKELQETYDTVYVNPKAAQKRAWDFEQKFGLEQTAYTLSRTPQKFGDIKGMDIFGFKLFGRNEALKKARMLDYVTLRKNHSKGNQILNWLTQMMGENKAA